MSYPPPPPPPLSPEPPPRRRNMRTVLIVVGVVLAVCLVGGSIGGFLVVRGFLDASAPARDATRAFINDLAQDRYAEAYQQLCQSARQRHGLDEFEQQARALGPVASHRFVGVSLHRATGASSATIRAELTLNDGEVVTRSFDVVQEGDQWRVCGDPF